MRVALLTSVIKVFDRCVDHFMPNYTVPDERRLSSNRLLVSVCIITSFFSLLYVSVSLLINFYVGAWLMSSCFVLLCAILALYKKTGLYRLSANLYLASCCIVAVLGCSFFSGGLHSMVSPWFALIPVAGILLLGYCREVLVWFLFCCGVPVAYGVAAKLGFSFPELYRLEYLQFFYTVCMAGLVMILFFIALIFDRNRKIALNQLLEQNDALEYARSQAETATIVKSEFIANMSHEIRTPMASILGFTEILQMTELNEKQHQYLSHIESASNSLLGIVNDILDFSKIEAGKLKMELVDFELQEVIEKVVGMFVLKALEKGLKLVPFVDPNIPCKLMGDPLRLEQALNNLVSNAVKFTRSGNILIRAELVDIDHSYCQVLFSVKDTGIGISEEELSQLFVAFTQADTSVTRKYGGTGLGLVITKNIVEMMGGEIDVKSIKGQGSTFSFACRFELNDRLDSTANNLQDYLPDSCHESAGEAADLKSTQFDTLHNARVLIVDDNSENRQIASEILEKAGVIVDFATNGKEAVAAVSSSDYDLVFMDIQMPVMGGYEAAALIRANDRYAELPIIGLTAHAMKGVRGECLAAGMNDCLSKPVTSTKLLGMLTRWIKSEK